MDIWRPNCMLKCISTGAEQQTLISTSRIRVHSSLYSISPSEQVKYSMRSRPELCSVRCEVQTTSERCEIQTSAVRCEVFRAGVRCNTSAVRCEVFRTGVRCKVGSFSVHVFANLVTAYSFPPSLSYCLICDLASLRSMALAL